MTGYDPIPRVLGHDEVYPPPEADEDAASATRVAEANGHGPRPARVSKWTTYADLEDTALVDLLRCQLRTTAQMQSEKRPPYLIEGVLPDYSLIVTFGLRGRGKTFVTLSQALCMANELDWYGRATQPARVLYIVAEGGHGIGIRTAAWQAEAGVATIEDVSWLGRSVNLLDAKWAQAVADLVDEENFGIVYFDTLSRCMPGGDENAAKDMTRVVDNCDTIRSAGAAVNLVHHSTKDGSTIRGHSVLEGAADTMVEVRKDGHHVTVRCEKQKDDEPFRDITLELRPVGESCVLDSLPNGPGSNTDSEIALLAAARQFAGSDGLPPSTLLKVSGMPERSFYNARKTLVRKGLLVNIGTDNRPRYVAYEEAAE